jgi:hypothetical protein
LSRDDNPQKQSLARNKLRQETHPTTTTTKDLLVINNCGGVGAEQKLIGVSKSSSLECPFSDPIITTPWHQGLSEFQFARGQVEQEVAALVQPHAFPDLLHAVTRGVSHCGLAIYIKILSKKPKSLKIL